MCGLKDAGAAFDRKVEIIMVDEFDARQGNFSLCFYQILMDKKRPLVICRHGDDFAVSGSRSDAKWFEKQLGRHLIVKSRGILGLCPEEGDVSRRQRDHRAEQDLEMVRQRGRRSRADRVGG